MKVCAVVLMRVLSHGATLVCVADFPPAITRKPSLLVHVGQV